MIYISNITHPDTYNSIPVVIEIVVDNQYIVFDVQYLFSAEWSDFVNLHLAKDMVRYMSHDEIDFIVRRNMILKQSVPPVGEIKFYGNDIVVWYGNNALLTRDTFDVHTRQKQGNTISIAGIFDAQVEAYDYERDAFLVKRVNI